MKAVMASLSMVGLTMIVVGLWWLKSLQWIHTQTEGLQYACEQNSYCLWIGIGVFAFSVASLIGAYCD